MPKVNIDEIMKEYEVVPEEMGETHFQGVISCFAPREKYDQLPEKFFGYWYESPSLHNAECFLVVGTTPTVGNKRIAKGVKVKLYTPELAWQEAQARAEECIKLQEIAMEDYSYSFKD